MDEFFLEFKIVWKWLVSQLDLMVCWFGGFFFPTIVENYKSKWKTIWEIGKM